MTRAGEPDASRRAAGVFACRRRPPFGGARPGGRAGSHWTCTARPVDAYVDCGRFPVTRFPTDLRAPGAQPPAPVVAGLSRQRLVAEAQPELGGRAVSTSRCRGSSCERERPDVVIGVLPAINGLLAEACAGVGATLEVVLTDWNDVHPFWQAPGRQPLHGPDGGGARRLHSLWRPT